MLFQRRTEENQGGTNVKSYVLNQNLSYGMYAIGVKDEKKASACIVNSVVQVSNQTPPMVAISMNRSNYSYECIEKYGIFSISVLSKDTPGTVIGALGFNSGKSTNKLENVRHKVLTEGIPVIKENTCCWFLCKVKNKVETATQTLYVAEVSAGSDESVGTPMTYEYYREKLKGASPKKSPTYLPPDKTFDKHIVESFVCSVCGYVYSDPNFGFEELQNDWQCPVCQMPKKVFKRR